MDGRHTLPTFVRFFNASSELEVLSGNQLTSLTLDPLWKDSGLSALVVMERETFDVAKQKTTSETSYYVSNTELMPSNEKPVVKELAQAIRGHWGGWDRTTGYAMSPSVRTT